MQHQHYDPVRFDSDQKDLLISQLKAQIFEHKQNSKDYDALHRELLNIQHRYALLQQEKNRLQDDYHARNDINSKTISNLRADADSLQNKLADKNAYVRDLNAELDACRDMLDRRNGQLGHVKTELATKQDINSKLHDDCKNMENQIDILRNNKRSNQIEIDRLLGMNDKLTLDAADTNKRLQDVEYELDRVNSRNNELNYIVDSKNGELREKDAKIMKLDDQGLRDHEQIVKLQGEIKDLESLADRHRGEAMDYHKLYDDQLNKNADLNARNSDMEAQLRERDFRISELRKELDLNRDHINQLSQQKRDLEDQLEVLKEHCSLLEIQNRELNEQLSDFVATSEQVRARLDRKRQIENLKVKNETQLSRSLANLSPYKSGSALKRSAVRF